GPDRFHASVNVDCDFSSSEENEETVDSTRSAVLTSQTTEESSGAGIAGGTPGTASNLPRPTARATSTGTGLRRRTENATYQPSRVVKHTTSPKGTIRRISTAVLVDQTVRWDGVGSKARRTLLPPSADVLKGVHDIIAGITGFTEQRGDQITVETLPFETTLEVEPPPAPPAPIKQVPVAFNLKQPTVIGGLAVFVLLAAAAVFIVLRRRRAARATDMSAAAIGAGMPSAAGPVDPKTAVERQLEQQISENDARQSQLESEVLSRIKLPASTRKTEVLVRHIRDSVHKDSVNATNVLRSWISETETKRST
ncbi:MAG TPA: flagellar M-ring protein FliF C-terminal domain-containing protein, partial [Bryobacteraceae bacterium]